MAGEAQTAAPSIAETPCDRLSGMPIDRDWLDFDTPGPVFALGGTKAEIDAIIAACHAASAAHPAERRFPFRLGLALKKAGRTDEALAAFETARRLGSIGGYDEAAFILMFGANADPAWSKRDPKAGVALLDEGFSKTAAPILAFTRAYGWLRGPAEIADIDRGLAEFGKLGEAGVALALFEVASHWWRKNVSPERDKEAIATMRRAVDLGSGQAAYRLGDWLRGKNDDEMIRLYRLGIARGDDDAMNALGYCYEHGLGVPRVGSLAIDNYEMAAKRGHRVAQANLGGLYAAGDLFPADYDKARHWLEIASEGGNGGATTSLGMLYDWGKGVPADLAKAKALYEKGAGQGDAGAMNNMGYLFEHGRGAEVDLAKAREWYEKGAEAGSADAANNLAEMYRHGVGVAKDEKKAIALSMKSAGKTNAKGINNLAMAYLRGEGMKKDPETARALFAEADALGSVEASHNLAGMMENGEGGEVDNEEARRLFRKAAQAGFPNSMYRYGNRVRLDADPADDDAYRAAMFEARNWLKRAVDAGDPYGVGVLARMIADGDGGPVDPAEALRLYRIAAKDDADLREELAGRLRSGEGVPADPAEARRILGETSSLGAWTAYLEMVDRGEGGPKDPKAGTDRLWETVKAGKFFLVGLLARRIDEGAGSPPDPVAARKLLTEQLHMRGRALQVQRLLPDAALRLGRMREEGRGGPVDPEGAVEAYREAAKGFEPESMTRLAAMLRRRGIPAEKVEARRLLERAGPMGGGMAFANFFEMLDRGEGGPADPMRAAIELQTALVVARLPEAIELAANPGRRVGAATRREFLKLMRDLGYEAPKGAASSGPLVTPETLAALAEIPTEPRGEAPRKPAGSDL